MIYLIVLKVLRAVVVVDGKVNENPLVVTGLNVGKPNDVPAPVVLVTVEKGEGLAKKIDQSENTKTMCFKLQIYRN